MSTRRYHGRMPIEERLSRYDEDEYGCWRWNGPINHHGYGRMSQKLAHRVAYEHWVAPIPEGMQIDHLCRVRSCINPAHMEVVTPKENTHRGLAVLGIIPLRRCRNGHEFQFTTRKSGEREGMAAYCKVCRNERRRQKYAEDKRILEAQDACTP